MTISQRLLYNLLFCMVFASCGTTSAPEDLASTETNVSQIQSPTQQSEFTATPFSSTATPDLNVVATWSAVETKIAQFPHVCRDNNVYPTFPGRFSPNGLWLEELCYSEDDQDLVLTLSNRESQVLWKLLYQDHIPQMDFVPDGGMAVVHWSKDGRYAYFFSFLASDGGECFYDGGDRGFGLFRVDLYSGQTATILPPNNNFWWYGFSLSSTDRRLVYGERAKDLKILDIKTGQLIDISSVSDFDEAGGFLWSRDGLKLVYSALTRDEIGERESYSLRLVDAPSGSERILLESPKDCYSAISWTEDNILTLKKNYSEAFVEFDLASNTIISGETPATP